jgi:hypothetical protein
MTSTELARMDTATTVALNGSRDALARLGQWVTAAQQAHTLVSPLVETPFVPDAYRPKVDPRGTPEEKAAARALAVANATAAVLQGITLGLDPLTALQQIYIIHGRPGMYTEAMVALVKGHGHEIWTEDISDSRAVVSGRRKGATQIERVTITMDQAKKAGWTTNQAYTKTPQDMLYARAAGRVAKRVAPDVLLGITSVEEIQDTIRATAEVDTGRRTVRRRAALPAPPAPAEEPPLDSEPVTESVTEPELSGEPEPGITPAQSRKMYALLRQTGREDKDTALVYLAGVIGRPVESTKELTKREARQAIDDLEQPPVVEVVSEEPPMDGPWPEVTTPPEAGTDGAA